MLGESSKRPPTATASYRRVLSSPPFLFLWLGVVFAYLTDRLTQLGLLEMVRPFVDKPGAVNNNITLFMMLPFVFLSPLAGPLVDRRSRRAILLVATSVKAIVLLFVVGILVSPSDLPRTVWFVYAAVAAGGVLTVFFSPARTALVPQLIESEHLLAANSLMNVTGMFMMLLGNFVAAFLLGWVSRGLFPLAAFFALGAGAYLIAVAFFGVMRVPAATRPAIRMSREKYFERLRAGLRYAATHGAARRLIALAAAFWFVAGLVYAALNGKLLDELRLGTDRLGYALGLLGVAVFAGGFALTFGFRRLPSIPATVRLVFLIVGVSALALLWIDRFVWLLAPIALIGLAGGGLLVLIITLIQRTAPRRMHGRIFSIVETCQNTALILALLGGTVALETVAFEPICWTVGAICLTAAGIGSITSKPRRHAGGSR